MCIKSVAIIWLPLFCQEAIVCLSLHHQIYVESKIHRRIVKFEMYDCLAIIQDDEASSLYSEVTEASSASGICNLLGEGSSSVGALSYCTTSSADSRRSRHRTVSREAETAAIS